jgi:cell wall-associated NlpC family hydrolase
MAIKLQRTEVEGRSVRVTNPFNKAVELHEFETEAEASAMASVVAEALSWVGTPFRDCTDVKGPGGGIDCAMLLVRAYVDTGVVPPFDPRPYPPQWHMNNSEEKFLEWLEGPLGCSRVDRPRLGDVVVYQYGRCYSHGALITNNKEIVHAYTRSAVCHVSLQTETDLMFLRSGKPRPRLYFRVG